MKNILFFLLLGISTSLFAQNNLKHSEQMITVVTSDWNSVNGLLQRYERQSENQKWKKMGSEIPVVIGKNGMAWGIETNNHSNDLIKKEGDGRTPAGIYEIGPGFGFADTNAGKNSGRLDYFPLTDTSVCVDDMQSNYYNQLLDSAKVPTVDWKSGEQMHQVPGYRIGSVVQYNMEHPVRGGGSCIFLHIWKNSNAGTAGCIAMQETNLKTVLNWLNSRKNPMIVILPENQWKINKGKILS
jgi:L,D-peptidoglycan transpeptidase YkuD (ErfK/YbiS/YcfS/YnhG family)